MNNTNQINQVFWNGRTACLHLQTFSGIVKVHEIVGGLITFTVIMHEGPERSSKLGREDRAFYQPGLTFTVPFSGERTVLRTLDDNQKLNLAEIAPVIKVGSGFGSARPKTT